MRKAVLKDRLYMTVEDEAHRNEIIQNLTYKIPSKVPKGLPEIYTDFHFIKNVVSVPVGRTDLIPEGYEIIDERVVTPIEYPPFLPSLRESQQEAYNLVNDNYVINALPGYGKTITALAIISKLKQKALIVTHTTDLRDQWAEEIKKCFGLEAGVVGSGREDVSDYITVSNVQTLTKRIQKYSGEFGLVVLDEMHKTPASTFLAIINRSRARYKIGLSGTLERKDKKHVYMLDYFTKSNIYIPNKENVLDPEVVVLKTQIPLVTKRNSVGWAEAINTLVRDPNYFNLIKDVAMMQASKGHKVLVVSDRVDFLSSLGEATPGSIIITGETPDRAAEIKKIYDADTSVIYGSISIFKEGISLNPLSCLILGTPINNDPMLTQLIGRIQRHYPNKKTPLVVDIELKGATAVKQAAARLALYLNAGYKVRTI
jgi:superfamily II DNA or RNA helicase